LRIAAYNKDNKFCASFFCLPKYRSEMTDAWCMKCGKKMPIDNPKESKTKNGRSRIHGVCGKCGTKIGVFIAGKKKSGGKSRSRSRSRSRGRH
jgi:DNA-directed RNA polymerase subunit RPC12/RpoP